MKSGEGSNQTDVIGFENTEDTGYTSGRFSIVLAEPNQTENYFQVQWVNDTSVSGLEKTPSALEDKLANAMHSFGSSANSILTQSLRSNNTATNGSEPCGSRANKAIEVSISIRASSNPNLIDCPILSRRVSEVILETLPPESTADNRYADVPWISSLKEKNSIN